MSENGKYHMQVTVHPQYLPEQSNESEQHYVFAYHVTIVNAGTMAAQLLTRHWVIVDADNAIQEVRGEGVVGEKPHLQPGEGFEYVSGTALRSPVGTMRGSYQFVADDGQHFDAPIDTFVLSVPRILH